MFTSFDEMPMALSVTQAAEVLGIAVSEGSELARDISDVTISSDNIEAILTLKALSDAMQGKIRWNYKAIISLQFDAHCARLARRYYADYLGNAAQSFHADDKPERYA